MPEMPMPPRVVPANDDGYFEQLTKRVFQSGFRWSVVDAKWPAFVDAFERFAIARVAGWGPDEVERLAADPAIVRNRSKIEATTANARAMQGLIDEHGSVRAWLEATAPLPWLERVSAVTAPFRYFGPVAAYFFLWSVGEAVPPLELASSWSDPAPRAEELPRPGAG